MTTYRYLCHKIKAPNDFVGEIELSGVSFDDLLNDAGELKAQVTLPDLIPPAGPQFLDFTTESGAPILVQGDSGAASAAAIAARAQAAAVMDAVAEAKRLLVVERNGRPIWCGPIWATPDNQTNPNQLDLRARQTWSYYRRRNNDADMVFTLADQFTVVRALLERARSRQGGDIGVTWGTNNSGVSRTISYARGELKGVAAAIEDLAKASDGFDWSIDPSWSQAGTLVQRLTLANRLGRPATSSGIVFVVGQNAEFTWPSDGSQLADLVWGLGANKVLVQQANAAMLADDYPLLEDVLSVTDIIDPGILTARTAGRLAALGGPFALPQLTVDPDDDNTPFGSYGKGDGVRLEIPPDRYARFPDGFTTQARIIGINVKPGDGGDEQIVLTLGQEP